MDSWPNQEALNKALNIYRAYMRAFVIFHLKKIPGEKVENVVMNSLNEAKQYDRAGKIKRELDQSDRDIKSIIDVNDFPHLIHQNWDRIFEKPLKDDKDFRNQLWLIKTRRDKDVAHPPEEDAECESTRVHLFLIAEVLRKINRPDKQHEVEAIRDELFFDDSAERLEKAEVDIAEYKKLLAAAEERLAAAESEKNEYREKNAVLLQNVDEKEKQRKKLDRNLKNSKKRNNKLKSEVAGGKKRLEELEAARADDKSCLETAREELERVKTDLDVSEERLTAEANRFAALQAEKDSFEECFRSAWNLLTTAAIGNQLVFPPLGTDSTVRMFDRRNIEKKNYLLGLLEQKRPTIIYVQNEDMANLLLTNVVPEKADVIEKHNAQTSAAQETEILEKLEGDKLIAIVSSGTISTLPEYHPIEHFVFCHLSPDLDTFLERCRPVFTSAKDAYMHLIYNSKQDIEGLDEWLTQKYPDRETLETLYTELKKLAATNGDFVQSKNVYDALDIAKLGIETGLAIFEELCLLERNKDDIKLLPASGRKLDESKIYCSGEKLKQGIIEVQAFQLEQSIEKIWDEVLRKVNIDDEQILRETDFRTQSEKSVAAVESERTVIEEAAEANLRAQMLK